MTRAERLQRSLAALVSRGRVPHAIMAVESVDGRFQWAGSAGGWGPAPPPDSPFFFASITKLYIAAAVLRLHERGLVDLETPFRAYLPGAPTRALHRLNGHDHTDSISVLHLLSHTSGLPDSLEESPRGGRSLLDEVFEQEDRSWTLAEVLERVRNQLRPHFPPQDLAASRVRARYSDTNYQLLIAILEALTGQGFAHVLDELIFQPLGLRHTWLAGRQPPPGIPPPTRLGARGTVLDRPLALASSNDLYGTAAGAITFLRALRTGALFEHAATAGLMTSKWRRFGLPLDPAALRSPSWPIEYGLGVMRFRIPRVFAPFRPAPDLVGHTGSTGSWLFHCPKLDLLLAGTVDDLTGGPVPFRFLPRLLRDLSKSPNR